jgi:hypothetical protein
VANIFISILSQLHTYVLSVAIFTAYFPLGSLRVSLISGVYIAVVTKKDIDRTLCWGGLEYLHHRPASFKRRQKGNPVSALWYNWATTWGYGPPGWGSLRRESKVWLRDLRDSDHSVIPLQTNDPSSHQRGRTTCRREKQLSNIRQELMMGSRREPPG